MELTQSTSAAPPRSQSVNDNQPILSAEKLALLQVAEMRSVGTKKLGGEYEKFMAEQKFKDTIISLTQKIVNAISEADYPTLCELADSEIDYFEPEFQNTLRTGTGPYKDRFEYGQSNMIMESAAPTPSPPVMSSSSVLTNNPIVNDINNNINSLTSGKNLSSPNLTGVSSSSNPNVMLNKSSSNINSILNGGSNAPAPSPKQPLASVIYGQPNGANPNINNIANPNHPYGQQ